MSVKLTEKLLSDLENLAKHAMPGPWQSYQPSEFPEDFRLARAGEYEPSHYNGGYIGRLTRSHDPEMSGEGSMLPREQDAKYIAAANPVVVLALIARVRELEGKKSKS